MRRTDLNADEIRDILKDSLSDLFGTWMIIWTERIYRRPDGNILAEVALARILEKNLTQFNSSKLDMKRLKTKSIPIELLSVISPGLLVKDGLLLFEQHYDYIKPERISINVDGVKSTSLATWPLGKSLRKRIGLGRTTIPYSTGRKASFGEKSNVYVIQNSNPSIKAEYIIYPSTELARFYLFRSSRMIESLIVPLQVSRKDNVFYDPKSLRYPSEEDPYHFMIIRDEMIVRDVPVLARIAFSREAKMAAEEIQTSLVNAQNFSQIGSDFFLNTFFPFTGETTHEVYGMFLSLDGVNVFLVLEISECYKHFPFMALGFAKEKEFPKTVDKTLPPVPGVGNDAKGGKSGTQTKIFFLYTASFDADTTRNNRTKNDRQIENAEYVDRRVRYPNLTPNIWRIREDSVAPKNENIKQAKKLVSNLSQNQQRGERTDSTGLDIISDDRAVEYKTPGNYADRIKHIVDYYRKSGCAVKYHNGIDEDGVEEFDFIVIDFNKRALTSDQLKFSRMPDGAKRRVIAFQVQYMMKHVLVMEFEPIGRNAYNVFHKADPSIPFVYSDVAELIEEAVSSVGGFGTLPKIYKRKRFYHEQTSPKHNAIKILRDLGFYKANWE